MTSKRHSTDAAARRCSQCVNTDSPEQRLCRASRPFSPAVVPRSSQCTVSTLLDVAIDIISLDNVVRQHPRSSTCTAPANPIPNLLLFQTPRFAQAPPPTRLLSLIIFTKIHSAPPLQSLPSPSYAYLALGAINHTSAFSLPQTFP